MTCSTWLGQGVLLTGRVGKGTTAHLQAIPSAGLADEREEAVVEEVWGVKTRDLTNITDFVTISTDNQLDIVWYSFFHRITMNELPWYFKFT